MTEQAKRAIQQMKQAGFLRSEFKVETERIYRPQYRKEGCRYPYDYGTAQVYVSGGFRDGQYVNGSEMIAEKLDAILAAGLGVMKHIGKSGYTVLIVLTDYSHQGKLQVCDFREDKTVPEFLRPREVVCV
jgi:hypothetical protein